MPVILGMDPSLASFGLALVETDPPRLLAYATIVTSARESRARRLRVLFDGICARVGAWMDKHAIDGAACEAGFAFGGGGRGADLAIAEARGVGLLAASSLGCTTIAPTTVRKAVCGSGAAKKDEVQLALVLLFGLHRIQADVADAAAVALTAGGYSVPPITRKRAPRRVTPSPRNSHAKGRPTVARRRPSTTSGGVHAAE